MRSLRNEVARALLEGFTIDWLVLRRALEDAEIAVDAVRNYAIVHGVARLLDELFVP